MSQSITLADEARETFLAHFPTSRRSTVANWFLDPVRRLHTNDPKCIVESVLDMLYRRLENDAPWATETYLADASAAIEIIQAHRDQALAFARYYIAYEAIPRAEREQRKAQRQQEYQAAWMDAQPPTAKQLSYLRNLGHVGSPPTSKLEASQAINQLLAARGKAGAR